tara:strand:+ start:65 stop:820 length:756 start_codon:yes stop_codon:yes gene_type:complete
MSKYIFIKTADDTAYMNTAANFRGAVHSTNLEVDLYFAAAAAVAGGGAFDKITLNTVADKEQEVMDYIGGALAGTHSKGMVVIADDIAKKYVNVNITSCGAFALATTASTFIRPVLVKTGDYQLTAADSGSIINLNDADGVLTLPTCAAGLNYTVVLGLASTAGAGVNAGAGDCFFGSIHVQGATDDASAMQVELITTTSKDQLLFRHAGAATLAGGPGDVIHITGINATSWHVDAQLTTTATPSGVAVIA